jgi:predicted nucleic-acid-binding Zn-ribbon protein
MSLDKVQEQIVSDWLQSKQVAAECPACRAEEWVILEMIEAPVRWPPELHSGGPGFPMIPRGCRNCGYLMFFSAPKMGLGTSTDGK